MHKRHINFFRFLCLLADRIGILPTWFYCWCFPLFIKTCFVIRFVSPLRPLQFWIFYYLYILRCVKVWWAHIKRTIKKIKLILTSSQKFILLSCYFARHLLLFLIEYFCDVLHKNVPKLFLSFLLKLGSHSYANLTLNATTLFFYFHSLFIWDAKF